MDDLVDKLTCSLGSANHWVALTGAGISAASGIPTYRDHLGRWLGSTPIQHQDFVTQLSSRRRYWSRSVIGWPRVRDAQPNTVHFNVTDLQRLGLIRSVITQNVDRLHQRAGCENAIDLHGRLDQVVCLDCDATVTRESIQQWLERHNPTLDIAGAIPQPDGDADLPDALIADFAIPDCTACGGTLMPNVVFFGGNVPRARIDACFEAINSCDGLLVLGSSLNVYSGYRFCRHAASMGKKIVILNEGITRADDLCDEKYTDAPFLTLNAATTRLVASEGDRAHG